MTIREFATYVNQDMALPTDMMIEIARQDKWLLSGSMARCSKQMLQEFVTPCVLKEIIESIKFCKGRLFKWLGFALPATYYPVLKEPIRSLSYSTMVKDELISTASDIFVSGGSVCQKIYQLEWEADIDIYVEDKYLRERRIVYVDKKKIDIFPTSLSRIERVIENFDLSIVQQGFLGEIYYLTPLSCYTQNYKEIIVMPNESNIEYQWVVEQNGRFVSITRTVDIWHYIHIHKFQHPVEADFHRCEECRYCQNLEIVSLWNKRVQKYCERFPSFTITYCQSSK